MSIGFFGIWPKRNLRKAHTFHCTSVFVHGKKMAHICQFVNIASKKITQPWDYIILFSFVERLTFSLLL